MLKIQALRFVPTAPVWEGVLEVWRRLVDRLGVPVARPPSGAAAWEALYVRAHESLRLGALEAAAEQFAEVLDADPAETTAALAGRNAAWDLLGRAHERPDARSTTAPARPSARRGMPDRHFAVRNRGVSVAEVVAYTKVLRAGRAKRRVHAYFGRGNAYLAIGRPELALLDYTFASKLVPDLADVLALRSEALVALGRYGEALAELDRAVKIAPASAEIAGSRAIARLAAGRMDEADAEWRRQLQLLAADNAPARACVLLRLADYAAAVPALDTACQREPTDPYWRLYRQTALVRLAPAKVGGEPEPAGSVTAGDAWPGPLLALHAGRMSSDEVLARADNAARRAEALFPSGLRAAARDRARAREHWAKAIDIAGPQTIEHGAARHELRLDE